MRWKFYIFSKWFYKLFFSFFWLWKQPLSWKEQLVKPNFCFVISNHISTAEPICGIQITVMNRHSSNSKRFFPYPLVLSSSNTRRLLFFQSSTIFLLFLSRPIQLPKKPTTSFQIQILMILSRSIISPIKHCFQPSTNTTFLTLPITFNRIRPFQKRITFQHLNSIPIPIFSPLRKKKKKINKTSLNGNISPSFLTNSRSSLTNL